MKNVLYFIIALVIIIVPIVLHSKLMPESKELKPYDRQVAAEDSATLVFAREISITHVNDVKKKIKTGYAKRASIKMPAGDYDFVLDYIVSGSSSKGIQQQITMRKGRIYEITYSLKDNMIYTSIGEITLERYNELFKK